MKKLFLLLVISCQAFGQDKHYIDSVKALMASKTDTIRFWAYSELTWILKDVNKDEALKYASNLLTESTAASKQKWIAQGYNDIGIVYIRTGDIKKGLFNIEKSLAIREKLGDKKDIASSLSKIANLKTEMGEYAKALEIQLKVLKLYEDLNIKPYIAHTCNNIGQLYSNINKFKLSNTYLMRAYSIEKEINDINGLPITLAIIGSNYSDLLKPDSAIKYLTEAKRLFKNVEDYTSYATACNNLGFLYRRTGRGEKGKENYQEAIEVSRQIGDSAGQVLYENNFANILIDEGKFDEAEKLLENSLLVSTKLGAKESVMKIYQSLTSLYIQKKDPKKADYYFAKYSQQKDSIFSNETSMRFSEAQTKFEVDKKDLELLANKKQIEKEQAQRNLIICILLFFVLLFSVATWAFIQKRKTSKLLQSKNQQLENANEKITHQKEELTEKQKEIVDSINYAKKIQNALLASKKFVSQVLPDYFILFKPKDIVSGDFTWATKKDNLFYLACCDSTGHGVPGAFMSLLNIGFLSEAIKERNILEPGKIFDYVRERLIETIGGDDQKDGFDGILICMDITTKKISYAAANNSPLLITGKTVTYLPANKMPVGDGIKTDVFTTHTIALEKNDALYLFTDGYADQFGGPKGKKFKYKQLEDLLLQNNELDLSQQKERLNDTFEAWRGNLEQVDDVCIIGIRI